MKYILIGGSGFIGSHFLKVLGESVILNLDLDGGINDVDFIKCNIINKDDFNKINIDRYDEITLIHLAAVHFDFQKKFFETNVIGTKNVLDFIDKNQNIKKYVFFSSVSTYGNSKYGKDENSIQKPVNEYGKSKLEAEKLILEWHRKNNNVNTIIIRPAVVFGEFNFGNVLNLILQIKSGFFAIIGNGKNIKSIAYAGNIVDSVIFCLENIKSSIFIYNYCDYDQLNISQQSKLILSIFNRKTVLKVPLFLTKLITIPVDVMQKLLSKDLKINSMRVEKLTISTHFKADKIREHGFLQKTSILDAFKKTIFWVNSVNISALRNQVHKKAEKL